MATRVLVADDSKTIRKAIELTFTGKEGYDLSFAGSYEEMNDLLSKGGIDLLIVDLGILPQGYDTLTDVRKSHSSTRILALHSYHSQFDESKGSCCHGHMTKPFLTEQFLKKVEEILSMEEAPAPEEVKEEAKPSPAASAPTILSHKKEPKPKATMIGMAPPPHPQQASSRSEKLQSILKKVKEKPEEVIGGGAPEEPQEAEEASAEIQEQAGAEAAEEEVIIEVEPPEEPSPAIDFGIFSSKEPQVSASGSIEVTEEKKERIPPRPRSQTILYTGGAPIPGGAPGMAPAGAPSPAQEETTEPTVKEKVEEKVAGAAVDEVVARISEKGPEYEAIAKLSREIIEKIAWEVVPQLSEVIIREIIKKEGLPKG